MTTRPHNTLIEEQNKQNTMGKSSSSHEVTGCDNERSANFFSLRLNRNQKRARAVFVLLTLGASFTTSAPAGYEVTELFFRVDNKEDEKFSQKALDVMNADAGVETFIEVAASGYRMVTLEEAEAELGPATVDGDGKDPTQVSDDQ
jgi:hypothetical protein